MANSFVHIELQTRNLAKAKGFYSRLSDWKLEDLSAPGDGMFANPDPKVPPHWLAYVGVDDIEASTVRARDPGATVLQDVMLIGDYGWLRVIMDPTGAVIAIWKPKAGA